MTFVRLTGPAGPMGDSGTTLNKVEVWFTLAAPDATTLSRLQRTDDDGDTINPKAGDWIVTNEPALYRVTSPTAAGKVANLPQGSQGPVGDPITTPPPLHSHILGDTTYQMVADSFATAPTLETVLSL
jgi:hypothetical protein